MPGYFISAELYEFRCVTHWFVHCFELRYNGCSLG